MSIQSHFNAIASAQFIMVIMKEIRKIFNNQNIDYLTYRKITNEHGGKDFQSGIILNL